MDDTQNLEDNIFCITCHKTELPFNTNIIKCIDCNSYYCNTKFTSPIPHIIQHMIRERHFKLELNNLPVKCFTCDNNNFFNLGFYKKNINDLDNQENILCLGCTKNSKKFQSLVCDKSIINEFLALNKIKIVNENYLKELEEDPIKHLNIPYPLQIKYETASEYKKTFKNLLKIEENEEKELRSKMVQYNVPLTKQIIGDKTMISFPCYFETSRLSPGIQVKIHQTTEDALKIIKSTEIRDKIKKNTANEYVYRVIGIIVKISDVVQIKVTKSKGTVLDVGTVNFLWNNVSYERMYKSIDKLCGSKLKCLKKIVLGNAKKDTKKSKKSLKEYIKNLSIKKEITEIKKPKCYANVELNYSQKEAILDVISGYANKFNFITMIQGPPGTGKSLCSTLIGYNLINQGKVLVTAPSNTAVDNLCKIFIKFNINIIRVISKNREIVSEMDNSLDSITLSKIVKNIYKGNDKTKKRKIKDDIIKNADIVLCTCVTAGRDYIKNKKFDYVIIDECAQAIEPLALIPIVRPEVKKIVLIGDHKQLGPVILNRVLTKKYKFDRSLFERLAIIGHNIHLLNVQYRMVPVLCEFPSNEFYNGAVLTDYSLNYKSHQKQSEKEILYKKIGEDFPKTFVYNSSDLEIVSPSGTSYLNISEGNICANIVEFLIRKGMAAESIGIITPYDHQKKLIQQILNEKNITDVEVANVDAYQGREKNFIILSLVRSNLSGTIGFLNERKRINVAITRAKYGLFVVCNINTVSGIQKSKDSNFVWKNFIDFYRRNDKIVEHLNFS